jgi:hypothetical protein
LPAGGDLEDRALGVEARTAFRGDAVKVAIGAFDECAQKAAVRALGKRCVTGKANQLGDGWGRSLGRGSGENTTAAKLNAENLRPMADPSHEEVQLYTAISPAMCFALVNNLSKGAEGLPLRASGFAKLRP